MPPQERALLRVWLIEKHRILGVG